MFRSCEAGTRIEPRPMRLSSARRRAATAAVSTGRPIPGSSGTTLYAPMGAGSDAERFVCAGNVETSAPTIANEVSLRMAGNLLPLDVTRVPERNYCTHDDQLGPDTRGSGTPGRADCRAGARAQAPARRHRDPEGSLQFLALH